MVSQRVSPVAETLSWRAVARRAPPASRWRRSRCRRCLSAAHAGLRRARRARRRRPPTRYLRNRARRGRPSGWCMAIGCSARPSMRAGACRKCRRGRCRCRHRRRRQIAASDAALVRPPGSASRSGNSRMSANITSGSQPPQARAASAALPACEPPVKAKTRMPAACAASMPAGLSSMTRQSSRSDAHRWRRMQEEVGRRLAARDHGGAE